jgi:hypothetical protein
MPVTSETKWSGFKPVGYWLGSNALALPLTQKSEDGKTDITTTVGSVYEHLKDRQIESSFLPGHGLKKELSTSNGVKVSVDGPDFSRTILDTMLRLRAENIDPFMTYWYFYDHGYALQDVQEDYSFFLVYGGNIVREQVTFFDDHYSGFEPSALEHDDRSKEFHSHVEAVEEATAKYWYRRFYTETQAGQMMVLRSDHPKLFYYEDLQKPDVMGALETIARSLERVRTLLWVLVIVTVLNSAAWVNSIRTWLNIITHWR